MAPQDLLDPTTLPDFSAISPESINAALDLGLAKYEAVVADLVTKKADTFDTLWLPLEQIETELDALWSSVSHLNAMRSDPALRDAHAAGEARYVAATTNVRQNTALYALLRALQARSDFDELPENDQAAVKDMVRDFELSGVALGENSRARFAQLMSEQAAVSTEFANAVQDATDAWSEHVTDPADLAGAPEASLGMFAAAAKARGLEGWLVTLQQPSVSAVMTFVENRPLRERVYRAAGTRASDQGPHAGQFDNSARIDRLLEIRKEAAGLLGFDTPANWLLATKMATDSGQVLGFLRELGARAKPAALKDLEELKAFAAQTLDLPDLEPWDVAFAAEQLRAAKFSVEEQAVRAYFPVERVLAGWRQLLTDLYGIELVERKDVDLWSEEAAFYDVRDADGAVIAGLYTDLHARPGKRGGAWMSPARPRLQTDDGLSPPIAYLVCNFAAKRPDAPALLSHADIATLLHETGHCLHHLFTLVDRPRIAGTSGFEWDAIELPSQLMEDFAWDFDLLSRMSGHVETGEPLPRDLFDKLTLARHFHSGLVLVRQLEFALFDMLLHQGDHGIDPATALELAREEASVLRPPAWHRFAHAFSHIFAGGYAAGYYSYLWAEVLAADGFQCFVENGLTNRETADRFRTEVLARGASRPAAESFRAFRGREPDASALLLRRGLAA